MILDTTAALRSYVQKNYIDQDNAFTPGNFEFTACIYRVRLHGSFLSTLMNRGAEEVSFWSPKGAEPYPYILRCLQLLTGYEKAYWFYVLENEKHHCSIIAANAARNENSALIHDEALQLFETSPAEHSGSAYLGLIGERANWLLLHTHYPEEDFSISIHGSTSFCNDLTKMLRARETGEE